MGFNKKIKESRKKMFDELDNIDIEGLKSEGVSMRVGDKILKFSIESETPIPEIDLIKKEFREKLNEQQIRIKDQINKEIEKINGYHNSLKIEMERKEKILEDKLKSTHPMPDITYDHAMKGLSVAKGQNPDTLCWLLNGIYWPKFVDFKPIDPKFTKRMVSSVVYMIITKGKYVTEVSTRKPIGLSFFEHYHQSSPDCWGKWTYKKEWSTADDIILIGKEAESVLENINTGSLANNNPRALPRINTVKKFVDWDSSTGTLSPSIIREGITNDVRQNDEEVWSL